MACKKPTPILIDSRILSDMVGQILKVTWVRPEKKLVALNKAAAMIAGAKHNLGYITGHNQSIMAIGVDQKLSIIQIHDAAHDLPHHVQDGARQAVAHHDFSGAGARELYHTSSTDDNPTDGWNLTVINPDLHAVDLDEVLTCMRTSEHLSEKINAYISENQADIKRDLAMGDLTDCILIKTAELAHGLQIDRVRKGPDIREATQAAAREYIDANWGSRAQVIKNLIGIEDEKSSQGDNLT